MRKYWILFILISFIAMFSCTDDTSAYLSQDKEDVNVDEVPVDTTKKAYSPAPSILYKCLCSKAENSSAVSGITSPLFFTSRYSVQERLQKRSEMIIYKLDFLISLKFKYPISFI